MANDRSFKKQNRVANTDASRDYFEESIASHNVVVPTDIWTEANLIPAAPTATSALTALDSGVANGVVTPWYRLTLTATDSPYAYTANELKNAVPYNWTAGGHYVPIVIDNVTTDVIPFDMYDIDWAAGVLTFNTLPTAPAPTFTMPPRVTFYQYTGLFGFPIIANPSYLSITVTQTTPTFSPGDVIYYNAGNTRWELADASDITKVATHIVFDVSGTTFSASSSGRTVINGATPFTGAPGWFYTSDTTPGAVTNVEPEISNPIGWAESTSVIHVHQFRAIRGGIAANDASVVFNVNQIGHGFMPGQIVYRNGTVWALANAGDINKIGTHIIGEVIDLDNFRLVSSGRYEIIGYDAAVAATATAGEWLYLSDSVDGAMTKSEGLISAPIGLVESIGGGNTIMNISFPRAAAKGFTTSATTNNGFTVTQAGMTVGNVVYWDGSLWQPGRSNNAATLATHMVVEDLGSNQFLLASSGTVTITGHGLGAATDWLFVSNVADGAVVTDPNSLSVYSNPIGFVLDANTIALMPFRATEVSTGSAAGSVQKWHGWCRATSNSTTDDFTTPVVWELDARYTINSSKTTGAVSVPTVPADRIHVSFYNPGANSIGVRIDNNTSAQIRYMITHNCVDTTPAHYARDEASGTPSINAGGFDELTINIFSASGVAANRKTEVTVHLYRSA